MKENIHPIATVTSTSGLEGDVRLRPLSRYFEDYIEENGLRLGNTSSQSQIIQLELITGIGKKRRFKFQGVDTLDAAEKIVGKTLFVRTGCDEIINMISKDLLGYTVVTHSGDKVGHLKDVMWLPSNDAYVIHDGKKEYLIPIIPEVIKRLDHELQRIVIAPMDGLLD